MERADVAEASLQEVVVDELQEHDIAFVLHHRVALDVTPTPNIWCQNCGGAALVDRRRIGRRIGPRARVLDVDNPAGILRATADEESERSALRQDRATSRLCKSQTG